MLMRMNRYLMSDNLKLAFNKDFKRGDFLVFLSYNVVRFVMYSGSRT